MIAAQQSTARFFLGHHRPPGDEASILSSVSLRPFAGPGLGAGHSTLWNIVAVDEPLLLDRMVSPAHGPNGHSCHDPQLSPLVLAHVPALDPYRHPLVPGLLRQFKRNLAQPIPNNRASLDPATETTDRILATNPEWACSVRPGVQRYLRPDCQGSDMALGKHGHIRDNPPMDNTSNGLVAG